MKRASRTNLKLLSQTSVLAVMLYLPALATGAVSAGEIDEDLLINMPDTIQPKADRDISAPPVAIGFGSVFGNSNHMQPQRPRLAVALPTESESETHSFSLLSYRNQVLNSYANPATPAVSWSLEAWQMNTASLAHIQCSSASRTVETFLVENCRFVDQPTPSSAVNLVQVEGRWMAAPGLQVGLGAFTGQQPVMSDALNSMGPSSFSHSASLTGIADSVDQVEGLSMNLSFGLQAGRIGDLILDLELSRYRRTPESFSTRNGWLDVPVEFGLGTIANSLEYQYQTAGQLGLGWRKNQFSADLIGQYRELPYWFGPAASGAGFNSFDIEFSWRAPINTSISVGISNILDNRPDSAALGDGSMEDSIDTIYGRIPYVRFKHDL